MHQPHDKNKGIPKSFTIEFSISFSILFKKTIAVLILLS